jgi:hypothetical protein
LFLLYRHNVSDLLRYAGPVLVSHNKALHHAGAAAQVAGMHSVGVLFLND